MRLHRVGQASIERHARLCLDGRSERTALAVHRLIQGVLGKLLAELTSGRAFAEVGAQVRADPLRGPRDTLGRAARHRQVFDAKTLRGGRTCGARLRQRHFVDALKRLLRGDLLRPRQRAHRPAEQAAKHDRTADGERALLRRARLLRALKREFLHSRADGCGACACGRPASDLPRRAARLTGSGDFTPDRDQDRRIENARSHGRHDAERPCGGDGAAIIFLAVDLALQRFAVLAVVAAGEALPMVFVFGPDDILPRVVALLDRIIEAVRLRDNRGTDQVLCAKRRLDRRPHPRRGYARIVGLVLRQRHRPDRRKQIGKHGGLGCEGH